MARLSASIVLVSSLKRVLMLKRPPHGSFPGASVFPGGAMDDTDSSLEECALRELFEETSITLNPATKSAELSATLPTFTPNSVPLAPVSEWTTPALIASKVKKVFKTQFFLFECENEPDLASFKPNSEAVSLAWVSPQKCLDQFKQGEILLFPPQFYLLSKLVHASPSQLAQDLANRVIEPKPIESTKEGVVMDWGKGEQGILKLSGKTITEIRFKL